MYENHNRFTGGAVVKSYENFDHLEFFSPKYKDMGL